MTETKPEISSQPGLILKTAREEMSLSIEHVAQELHLRPAVVKALEEENYKSFSSDVFLKGYFRTYCRLLKLQESRMVELLDKQLGSINEKLQLTRAQENKVLLSRKRRKKLISFLIFLLCAGLVALTYYLTMYTPSNESEGSANRSTDVIKNSLDEIKNSPELDNISPELDNISPELDNISPELSNISSEVFKNSDGELIAENKTDISEEPSETEYTNDSSDEYADSIARDNADISSSEVDQISLPSESDKSENNSLISARSKKIQTLNENASIEQNSNNDSTVISTLYAAFKGECWFKVTDGNGKTLIADLKNENQEINLKGVAPFNIVIGDVSKVRLEFNGRSIDLQSYKPKNGRAELNLKP